MPHKRNPILSERIAGLARLLRGYAHTALEDQPLWHERDISHARAERVILPDATILLDYMLVKMTGLIEGLVVRSERMRENIERGLGLHASSRVLVALVERGGLSREEAYAIVQRAALRAADERRPLRELLAVDPTVAAQAHAWPTSTPASTMPRSSATSPRSSPDSTAWRPRSMSPASPLADSFLRSGKVRDLYALGDDRLLLVASDRLSALRRRPADRDPRQGPGADGPLAVLVLADRAIVPNHLLGSRPRRTCPPSSSRDPDAGRELRGRMMLCRRVDVLPIEVIVRGYLAGSGWKDYRRTGAVCGIALPAGLRESDRLPEPLFTPSTKAEQGAHDENIDLDEAARLDRRGRWPQRVRDVALALYRFGSSVAEPAGIILADTKFEFGIDRETGELLLIDEVLTPDSSRFWDAATYEPGRRAGELRQAVRPRLARGPAVGQDAARPGAAGRHRRRDARPLRRGVRADHRRELRSLPRRGHDRPMSTDFRFAVNVTPKDGHPRPAGPGGRGQPRPPRDRGRVRRPRRAAGRADGRRPTTRRRPGRSSSGSPRSCCRTRSSRRYDVEELGAASSTRRGAAHDGPDRGRRLPGLEPRHRRGQRPRGRRRRAGRCCGTSTPSLDGVAGVILPGGFAYGDYLRAGVIARFSPVMRSVAAFAADGGLVLGICNGFQVLTEAHLLPGALLRNRGLRFVVARGRDRPGAARHAVHPGDRRAPAAADAGRPRRGLLLRRRRRRSTSSSATARSCSATPAPTGRRPARRATAANPNGSLRAIAGVMNAAGNVAGLMPHPETAVEAVLGSDDGLGIIRSFVESAAERAAAGGAGRGRRPMTLAEPPWPTPPMEPLHRRLGVTDDELDAIRDRLGGRDPNDLELAMFSVMWSEHCSYKSSRPLLRTLPTGRRGRRRRARARTPASISIGDGLAVAFKIESHNHPSAVEPYQGAATGVGGHPPRHLHDGRPADRGPRRAPLRRPGVGPDAAPRRRRRPGRRRLRQLRRRADGRRRARLRPELRGQPARQRDGDRAARGAAAHPGGGARARATSSCCSARRPAATASAGRASSRARRSATTTPRSARASRSATRSPRSCSSRPRSS